MILNTKEKDQAGRRSMHCWDECYLKWEGLGRPYGESNIYTETEEITKQPGRCLREERSNREDSRWNTLRQKQAWPHPISHFSLQKTSKKQSDLILQNNFAFPTYKYKQAMPCQVLYPLSTLGSTNTCTKRQTPRYVLPLLYVTRVHGSRLGSKELGTASLPPTMPSWDPELCKDESSQQHPIELE